MSFVQEHTNDDGQGWPYAVKDTTAGMQEVERIRTNIGHIRVKMSGTNFPDRVEEVRERRCTGCTVGKGSSAIAPALL